MRLRATRLTAIAQAVRRLGAVAYNPRTVFGANLITWYGNSVDELWRAQAAGGPVTMYQDGGGATPVTALEQTVGLVLDQAQGLVLGSELMPVAQLTVGNFVSGTSAWDITDLGDRIRITRNSAPHAILQIDSLPVTEIGAPHYIGVTLLARSSGVDLFYSATNGGAAQLLSNIYTSALGLQQHLVYPNGGGNGRIRFAVSAARSASPSNALAGDWVEISKTVRMQSQRGNHLSQATPTARMRLSARYNLLPNSAFIGGGAAPTGWNRPSATGSSEPAAAQPDGSVAYRQFGAAGTRPYLQESAARSVTVGQVERFRVRYTAASGAGLTLQQAAARAGTATATEVRRLNGVVVPVSTVLQPGDEVELVWTFTGSGTHQIRIGPGSSGNMATDYDCTFVQPDARLTVWPSSWPQYQRTTPTDYDTASFPARLVADGIDDSYVSNSIGLTATDKVTVLTAVKKLSDAAQGMVVELGAGAQNGSFNISASSAAAANYGIHVRGTSNAIVGTGNTFPAPRVDVLTAVGDIAGDSTILRVSGIQAASSAADLGSGNFGNLPLHVGRRNLSSLPFNGSYFALPMIVRQLMTDEQRNAAERAFGRVIGVLQ